MKTSITSNGSVKPDAIAEVLNDSLIRHDEYSDQRTNVPDALSSIADALNNIAEELHNGYHGLGDIASALERLTDVREAEYEDLMPAAVRPVEYEALSAGELHRLEGGD